jgi:hypothetical protein
MECAFCLYPGFSVEAIAISLLLDWSDLTFHGHFVVIIIIIIIIFC